MLSIQHLWNEGSKPHPCKKKEFSRNSRGLQIAAPKTSLVCRQRFPHCPFLPNNDVSTRTQNTRCPKRCTGSERPILGPGLGRPVRAPSRQMPRSQCPTQRAIHPTNHGEDTSATFSSRCGRCGCGCRVCGPRLRRRGLCSRRCRCFRQQQADGSPCGTAPPPRHPRGMLVRLTWVPPSLFFVQATLLLVPRSHGGGALWPRSLARPRADTA